MEYFDKIETIITGLDEDAIIFSNSLELEQTKEKIATDNKNFYIDIINRFENKNKYLNKEVKYLRDLKETNRLLKLENKTLLQNNNALKLKTEELLEINKPMLVKSITFDSSRKVLKLKNNNHILFIKENTVANTKLKPSNFFSRKIKTAPILVNKTKNKSNVKQTEKGTLFLKEKFKKLKIVYE